MRPAPSLQQVDMTDRPPSAFLSPANLPLEADRKFAVGLVLGAAVRPDGMPSPTFHLRICHAVALHRIGTVTTLCFTGGQGRFGAPEAHVARDIALSMGVPAADIVTEDQSANTFENIAFAVPLLPDGPVCLISNRWHLPRAWIVARLLGLSVTTSGPRATAPVQTVLAAILREVAAMPVSAVRAIRWARRSGQ